MPIKTCNYCQQALDISFFHKKKNGKHGVRAQCIACAKEYIAKNRKAISAYNLEYYYKNPEKSKQWRTITLNRHRGTANAKTVRRKAAKLKATPKWANLTKIKAKYQLAAMFNKHTEEKWHVDHIIPLRGKDVCGLHVEYNLRVIPAKENLQKSNRFEN
jgi:hypothetical protein